MTLKKRITTFCKGTASLIIILTAVSCSKSNEAAVSTDTLAKIGKASLTRSDLDAVLPGGISNEDSVKFSKIYIRSWIDIQLANQIASKEIDMSQIDKMVEQYRNELIMYEYSRRMYDAQSRDFSEDTLSAYYESHKNEFVLNRPMVKGVYLKIAENSKSLPSLRKIYRSQKSNDIDKLDKSMLAGAEQYDYFRDTWIDWEQIESRIPYEFGASADAFLRNHKNLDFTDNGYVYLLDITDVLHTGDEMPYSAALSQIKDKFRFSDRQEFEQSLKQSIYENALESGKLKIYCGLD